MNVRHARVRRQQGFTLIELLVVITIIGILTAIAIPTFGVVQKMMNKTRAKTLCVSIATAITQYQTEYAVYPATTGMSDTGGDATLNPTPTTGWINLCNALNGNKNLATAVDVTPVVANTRNIPYLSAAKKDISTDGYIMDPLSITNDAFNLRMDTNYDNVLVGLPNLSTDNATYNVSGGVAVWSSANGTGKQKQWVSNY